MSERNGWGAALSSICSAELLMIAVITGAGLASLIVPEHIDTIAVVGALIVAGALLFQRRRSKTARSS